MSNEPEGSIFTDLRSLVNRAGEVNGEHVIHIARRFIAAKTTPWGVEDIVRAEFGFVFSSWSQQTRKQRLSDFETLRCAAQRHGMPWIEKVIALSKVIGGRTKERIRVGMRYLAFHATPNEADLRRCMVQMNAGLRQRA